MGWHMEFRQQEINLQKRGMRRRKKEVRHMKIMTGLTVLFLAVTFLFQDNMNQYQMEMNYHNYGEWFMRQPARASQEEMPYQEKCGEIWSGCTIYKSLPEDQKRDLEINPSDTERYTGKILGTLDDGIVEAGHIRLYEGKMPEQENEIAMELNVLQALGYDYELGQEISFYLAEEEDTTKLILNNQKMKLHQLSFTLVGTIKNYTSIWNEGEVLPGAVISEEVFAKLRGRKEGYVFSRIREEYAGDDVCIFANELQESSLKKLAADGINWSEEGYSFNENAYSNPFWSNRTMYRNMTLVLVLLGMSIMAYLMSSYLAKRRKYYYQLREIGASVFQIWRMAGYECIGSTVWTSLATLLLSYGVSIVIVFGVARAAGIPFFYVFRLETLFQIILCVSSILCVSMFVALLLFRRKRISDNKNAIPRFARKRLKHRAKKRKKPIAIKDIWKREAICHPFSIMFSRIVGILSCLLVLACLMQINEQVLVYRRVCQAYRDFTVSGNTVKRTIGDGTFPVEPYIDENGEEKTEYYFLETTDICSMENIFSDAMLQSIQDLSGVRQIDYSVSDQTHVFSWEGKGESDYYINKIKQQTGTMPDVSTVPGKKLMEEMDRDLFGGWYFKNSRSVWKDLKRHLDKKIANYEDFKKGRQVILLEFDLEWGWEDNPDHYIKRDETLQAGDTLTIQTKGKDIAVTVAAVLSAGEIPAYGSSAYNIVGSEALGKKIAAEDGMKYGYNHMEIDFNALADSEATGKILSRICDANNLGYDSGSEYIRAAFQKIMQAVLVYGTLAAIIFILYIFVLSCILQEKSRESVSKMQALHQLGIPLQKLIVSRRKNGLKEAVSLLAAVPVLYVIWVFRVKEDLAGIVGYFSFFFGKEINAVNESKYIFYIIMDDINLVWVIIFMAFACGAVFLLHWRESRRKQV